MLVFKKSLSSLSLFFAVLLLLSGNNWLAAQKISIAEDEEQGESQFHVMASVHLGLTGINTSYQFAMVDENGFQYDLLSMTNPYTVKELGLSDEQADELIAIKAQTIRELRNRLGGAGAVVVSNDELEAQFHEAEDAIREKMTDEQLQQMNQLRNRMGIRQVGLAKYLSSSQFDDPVSDEEVKALEAITKAYIKKTKAGAVELLRAANREMIEQLNESQQAKLTKEFTAEFEKAFVATPMFNQKYSAKKSLAKKKTDLYRVLKLKSVRTGIGLQEDQYSEIKQLDRSEREQVNEKLTAEQSNKLNQKVAESDLKRMGSVNALCGGYLRQLISIDDQQADELHKQGKQINEELQSQLKTMQKEVIREVISPLSKSTQEMLLEAIGDSGLGMLSENSGSE